MKPFLAINVFAIIIFLTPIAVAQIPINTNKTDTRGRRQGPWTILFDEEWKIVSDTASAQYYRIITYKKDKPILPVSDFYKNGIKQFSANLLADRPKEIIDGLASWFKEDGSLKYQAFYSQGKREGELKLFFTDGKLITESWNELNSKGFQLHNSGKYREALEFFEKAYIVASFQFDAESPTYLKAVNNLAALLSTNGNYSRSEQLYIEAIEIYLKVVGPEHVTYANSLKNLGLLYHAMHRYKETEVLYIQVAEIRRKVLGSEHVEYAHAISNLATLYNDMGKSKQAEELFLECKRLYDLTLSKDNIDYAILVNNMASFYQDIGKPKIALPLYVEARELLAKRGGTQNTDYIVSTSNLASIYEVLGSYAQAEALYLENKKRITEQLGTENPEYASLLNKQGILYKNMGLYAKAEPLYLEAIEVWRKSLGDKNGLYANGLNNLALLYESMGQYAKAEPFHFEALAIRKEVFGEASTAYAQSLNNLGVLYKSMGLYAEAEKYYQQATQTRLQLLGSNHPDYASSLNNLSYLYKEMGDYQYALSLATQALDIREKVFGKDHPDYAGSISNLADLYQSLAEYTKAEKLFLQAKEIKLKIYGKESPVYASILNDMGGLYDDMGNFKIAADYYVEAEAIRAVTIGTEHPAYATTLNNIGMLQRKSGNLTGAEITYEIALEIRGKTLGKEHPDYGQSLENLATLYTYWKKYDKAEPLFLQARDITIKTVGKNHPHYASSLSNLAVLYFLSGAKKKAIPFLLEAQAIYTKVYGKKHPAYILTTHNMAEIYLDLGEMEKSIALYRECKTSKVEEVVKFFPSLSENERKAFLSNAQTYFTGFEEMVLTYYKQKPELIADLYNLRLATKGLLFNSSNKIRERILRGGDQALIGLFKRWQLGSDLRSKVFQMSDGEKKNKGIDEAKMEEELNSLEKELSFKSEVYKTAGDNREATWKAVQKKLMAGEAAIEVVRTYMKRKDEYVPVYAMLLLRAETIGSPQVIVMEKGQDMEGRYSKFYGNAIKQKLKDEVSYNQYWKPIADKIKGVKKVYFSADGVYNQINLNSLFNPVTGKYVIDETEIQVVTSTKDLITKNISTDKTGRVGIKEATLFGYPNYNGAETIATDFAKSLSSLSLAKPDEIKKESGQRFFNGENITELPGTKMEVESIEALLKKKNIALHEFMFDEATETEIKKLNNPQVLHIATHGFFLSDLPAAKENERGFAGMETRKMVENPLLRSGLLFAGVKNAFAKSGTATSNEAEDGILTAYEAMNLDLDQTDLVVMSACETGLGVTANGEGVYGLQRAFQVAGAKSVLMSLWTVSDEATQKLMTMFYENWLGGKTPREAFRMAQLLLREKYPEPYYWGAFVLVGN